MHCKEGQGSLFKFSLNFSRRVAFPVLLLGGKYIFFFMYRFLKKLILPKANCFTILVLYVYNVILLFNNNNNKIR